MYKDLEWSLKDEKLGSVKILGQTLLVQDECEHFSETIKNVTRP